VQARCFLSVKQTATTKSKVDREVTFLSPRISSMTMKGEEWNNSSEFSLEKARAHLESVYFSNTLSAFIPTDWIDSANEHTLRLIAGNDSPVHVYVKVSKPSFQGKYDWVSVCEREYDGVLQSIQATDHGYILVLKKLTETSERELMDENEIDAVVANAQRAVDQVSKSVREFQYRQAARQLSERMKRNNEEYKAKQRKP